MLNIFVIRKSINHLSPPVPCTETDQTNSAILNTISIEVPLNTDLNDPEISKTVLPNDPALPFLKERIERHAKLSERPCLIRLLSNQKLFLETDFVAFKMHSIIIVIG